MFEDYSFGSDRFKFRERGGAFGFMGYLFSGRFDLRSSRCLT